MATVDPSANNFFGLKLSWANGTTIQRFDPIYELWLDETNPEWNSSYKYRIKTSDDIIRKATISLDREYLVYYNSPIPNVQFTFDSKSSNLKSVQVISNNKIVASVSVPGEPPSVGPNPNPPVLIIPSPPEPTPYVSRRNRHRITTTDFNDALVLARGNLNSTIIR